jgi:lysophospholipase L1-like esterase
MMDMTSELQNKTPDWRSRTVCTVMRDALIFIAVVCVIEIVLRVFVPSTARLIFTETLTGGHSITYNEYGLRDVEFPREKLTGETRILALGNSTTFGSGVALDETYAKQLQTRLGGNTFVINGGGQGSSMPEITAFMERDGWAMRPDRILFGFSPAMIAKTKIMAPKTGNIEQPQSLKRQFRQNAIKIHKAMHASHAYAAFDYYVRKQLYTIGVLTDDLTQVRGALYAYAFDVPGVDIEEIEGDYTAFFEQFEVFAAAAREHGVEMTVVGLPSRFELAQTPQNNPRRYPLDQMRISPLERMADQAQRLNLKYIDMRPVLNDQTGAFIPADYSHLNATGMKIIAEHID